MELTHPNWQLHFRSVPIQFRLTQNLIGPIESLWAYSNHWYFLWIRPSSIWPSKERPKSFHWTKSKLAPEIRSGQLFNIPDLLDTIKFPIPCWLPCSLKVQFKHPNGAKKKMFEILSEYPQRLRAEQIEVHFCGFISWNLSQFYHLSVGPNYYFSRIFPCYLPLFIIIIIIINGPP